MSSNKWIAAEAAVLFASTGMKVRDGRQSWVTSCPKSSCRKDGHFYIRKRDGRSICFKCGIKLNWRGLLQMLGRAELMHEAVEKVDVLDPHCFGPLDEAEAEGPQPILLGHDFIPVLESERGLKYLWSRGVSDRSLISRFDIKYHGWMDAVVFPIRKDGELYGWQARKIDPPQGVPRLLTSPGFQKARFLLNWDLARQAKAVILVEGPFDCLKADATPHVRAVASLGKQVSYDQVTALLSEPSIEEVYVGLDDDAAEEVYDVVGRLSPTKKVYRVRPPEGSEDFGECSAEAVARAILDRRLVSARTDWLEVSLKGV